MLTGALASHKMGPSRRAIRQSLPPPPPSAPPPLSAPWAPPFCEAAARPCVMVETNDPPRGNPRRGVTSGAVRKCDAEGIRSRPRRVALRRAPRPTSRRSLKRPGGGGGQGRRTQTRSLAPTPPRPLARPRPSPAVGRLDWPGSGVSDFRSPHPLPTPLRSEGDRDPTWETGRSVSSSEHRKRAVGICIISCPLSLLSRAELWKFISVLPSGSLTPVW